MCVAWCLIGGSAELEVAQSAASAFQQHYLLSVVGYVAYELTILGVIYHCSWRHVDVNVLAVGAVTFVSSAVAAMFSENMSLIAQVEQSPVVVVATQYDATALAAVATVGTAVRVVFHMAQVHGAATALA